jgi:hypothetical protein
MVTDPSPLNVAVPVVNAYAHPEDVSDGFAPLKPLNAVL